MSFWSGTNTGAAPGEFARFNINTGALEVGPVSLGSGHVVLGICVKGEITVAQPTLTPTNTPTDTPTITRTPTRTNTPTNTPIPTVTCAAGSGWCTSISPNGAGVNELHGVAAIKEADIWAVGGYDITAQGGHSLFEHWDGTSWTTATPVPDIGTLNGVAGIAGDDVWVAGDGGLRHWRGTGWVEEPSDDPNLGIPWYGVTALSSSYAWAVGSAIQRWDGSTWRTSLQDAGGTLKGVAAVNANDAWAVGYTDQEPNRDLLVWHWDGST